MDDVDALLGDLMNKIGTITTEDPEELVKAFAEMTGCERQLSTFFLEANRWNLQSAIISYFDTGGQSHQEAQEVPSMSLVADITPAAETGGNASTNITSVMCNEPFTKIWRLTNTGRSVWPPSFLTQSQTLHQNTVELLRNLVPVPQIGPGEMCDVTAVLHAPSVPGECVGVLRLVTGQASIYFGDEIWVLCNTTPNPNESVGVDIGKLTVDSMEMSDGT